MPYYINNPFPFWDFVASAPQEHPFFAAYNQGPPPYASREGQAQQQGADNNNSANANAGASNAEHAHSNHRHHGPPRPEGDLPFRGRGGPCGLGARHHRRGGGCGFGGRRHETPRSWPWGDRAPQDFNDIADLARFLFGGDAAKDTDFSPAVDVFNTPDHFIVHVSLPGAKKGDIAVDWDIETKILKISGVVYRPDISEEMLKALVQDERKVGFFERKVALDEETGKGKVDEEKDITAKLEDGVLVVKVPKIVEKPKESEKGKDAEMGKTEKGAAEEEQEEEQEDEPEYVRVEVE
jgi:HSP20 family protein